MQKNTTRHYALIFIILLLFGGLSARLAQIQLWEPHAYGPQAVDLIVKAAQGQSESFLVDSGRGTIYDRHGHALTGERDYHVIVFPLIRQASPLYEEQLRELAVILGWTDEQLLRQLRHADQPQLLSSENSGDVVTVTEWEAEQIQRLRIPGVHALLSERDRYASNRIAHHLLGTIGIAPEQVKRDFPDEWEAGQYDETDAIGLRGLEAAFEPFLHNAGVNHLTYTVDGKGRPLNGEQTAWVNTLKTGDDEVKSLVTTIDAEVQDIVEKAMDETPTASGEKSGTRIHDGAAVVLDIASGDILAMASRPREGEGADGLPGWVNRALQPVEAGSIFKTAVAVAALNEGLVTSGDVFVCDGELEAYNLSCWTNDEGGHGQLTFAEAFADSCNVVFGKLAVELGGETIASYARKLGLGRTVGWQGTVYRDDTFAQMPEEEAGQIFHDEHAVQDVYALAQTGIGQRDVRVTPLQAANMVAALFHPGELPRPRVVSAIQYASGDPYFDFSPIMEPISERVKEETLRTVRELMLGVVDDGTASSRLSDAVWSLGGKTGTAEIANKEGKTHKWMVGYGPAEAPEYAVAVVAREASGDGVPHLDTFRAIMDGLGRLPPGSR